MATRGNQGNRLLVFLPLATAFAIIAGIAIYGVLNQPKAKPNPDAPGFRGSLVWGDGIFANKAQLKAWLKLHGASYQVWVKQHPAALRLVKPPVKRHLAARATHKVAVPHRTHKVAVPRTTHKTAVHKTAVHKTAAPKATHKTAAPRTTHKTAAPVATVTPVSSPNRLLIWLAVLAGLLFGGIAALPTGIIGRAGVLGFIGERELRLGALGAGAAVLLGVIVATFAA